MQSPNEESYNEHLKSFTNWCTRYKVFVDYVQNTWLTPFKEKFVQTWTNRVMHPGNKTTNRYINYLKFFNVSFC